jgi:phosphoribosylformylglycinamidine synthase
MGRPRSVVLRAPGTNCDEETAEAWRLAGAEVESIHVGRLLDSPRLLDGAQILTIPGGFSYGDDLGAGRILAARLGAVLGDAIRRFHDRGGLILGVCNGFQVLTRAGLLPGGDSTSATLAHNDSGRFESRWVRLKVEPGNCPFLAGSGPIELPVAHGEGKFLMTDDPSIDRIEAAGQIVLRYIDEDGRPTQTYPANPNGSARAIAGICDPTGRTLGLMPHPERYIDPLQHPRWTRHHGELPAVGDGMRIFTSAVATCA